MALDKVVASAEEAFEGIGDGATVLVSGFGGAGSPVRLLDQISRLGLCDLTVVSNNAGSGLGGLAGLLGSGSVTKIICSYPRTEGSVVFPRLYAEKRIELELVPQGTLSERIRAAGAGIGGFFTPTAAGTLLAEGRESRVIDGREYVLELPIHADLALVRGYRADRWGNTTYNKTARNYGPSMAMAAKTTIVEVDKVVPLGAIDPELVITPGVFVDRVLEVS